MPALFSSLVERLHFLPNLIDRNIFTVPRFTLQNMMAASPWMPGHFIGIAKEHHHVLIQRSSKMHLPTVAAQHPVA